MKELEEIIILHTIAMEAVENCAGNEQNFCHVMTLMQIVKDKLAAAVDNRDCFA